MVVVLGVDELVVTRDGCIGGSWSGGREGCPATSSSGIFCSVYLNETID